MSSGPAAAASDAAIPGDLADEIAGAAERGELELHFQPEVELATGLVVGMEALLRWANPTRGQLWPADFLSAAALGGHLPEIGRWALRSCAQEAATWPPGRRCWVNVSTAELADPGYAATVRAVVAGAGLAPGTLGLDLAEAALTGFGTGAAELCARLRAAGVALAVDDVGAAPPGPGGAPLPAPAFLAALGLDAVKIGRALVRGVQDEPELQAALRDLVEAAHAGGLLVVAAGVESWPEALALAALGVDRGHGFLFSGSLRADRARWMLQHPEGWRGSYVGDGEHWAVPASDGSGVHDALPERQVGVPGSAGLTHRGVPHPFAGGVPGLAPPAPLPAPASAAEQARRLPVPGQVVPAAAPPAAPPGG